MEAATASSAGNANNSDPWFKVGGAALGLVGAAAVFCAIALIIEAIAEMRHGGLGSYAVFALPLFAAFLALAGLTIAAAVRIARGQSLLLASGLTIAMTALALYVVPNGQWFRPDLSYDAFHRSSSPPARIIPWAVAAAGVGAIGGAAIVIALLRQHKSRRIVVVGLLVAATAFALSLREGVSNASQSTSRARYVCAEVLAIEDGLLDPRPYVLQTQPIPKRYSDRCRDPEIVARSHGDRSAR